MDFLELCAKRYSVRSYSDRTVPAELLEKVLEAGRLAPTAKNQQSQRIYLLESGEALEKLRAIHRCYDAPTVMIVCGDTEAACCPPLVSHNLAEMDASIVATHMMLSAADLGLGSVWICAFDNDAVAKAFDLPDHIQPYLLLPIGYPSDDCVPNPRHTLREPLEKTVTRL